MAGVPKSSWNKGGCQVGFYSEQYENGPFSSHEAIQNEVYGCYTDYNYNEEGDLLYSQICAPDYHICSAEELNELGLTREICESLGKGGPKRAAIPRFFATSDIIDGYPVGCGSSNELINHYCNNVDSVADECDPSIKYNLQDYNGGTDGILNKKLTGSWLGWDLEDTGFFFGIQSIQNSFGGVMCCKTKDSPYNGEFRIQNVGNNKYLECSASTLFLSSRRRTSAKSGIQNFRMVGNIELSNNAGIPIVNLHCIVDGVHSGIYIENSDDDQLERYNVIKRLVPHKLVIIAADKDDTTGQPLNFAIADGEGHVLGGESDTDMVNMIDVNIVEGSNPADSLTQYQKWNIIKLGKSYGQSP